MQERTSFRSVKIFLIVFQANLKGVAAKLFAGQARGGYLTREVTGVCGKPLNTLYPVA